MQGNCSGPPPELNLTPPLDERNGQCVVQVREDFLEQHLQHSVLFIANLYITVPGVEKNHTTLIGVHGGDIYMTGMTFVGDGDRARAIDVKENRRVYVGRASRKALNTYLPTLEQCELLLAVQSPASPTSPQTKTGLYGWSLARGRQSVRQGSITVRSPQTSPTPLLRGP